MGVISLLGFWSLVLCVCFAQNSGVGSLNFSSSVLEELLLSGTMSSPIESLYMTQENETEKSSFLRDVTADLLENNSLTSATSLVQTISPTSPSSSQSAENTENLSAASFLLYSSSQQGERESVGSPTTVVQTSFQLPSASNKYLEESIIYITPSSSHFILTSYLNKIESNTVYSTSINVDMQGEYNTSLTEDVQLGSSFNEILHTSYSDASMKTDWIESISEQHTESMLYNSGKFPSLTTLTPDIIIEVTRSKRQNDESSGRIAMETLNSLTTTALLRPTRVLPTVAFSGIITLPEGQPLSLSELVSVIATLAHTGTTETTQTPGPKEAGGQALNVDEKEWAVPVVAALASVTLVVTIVLLVICGRQMKTRHSRGRYFHRAETFPASKIQQIGSKPKLDNHFIHYSLDNGHPGGDRVDSLTDYPVPAVHHGQGHRPNRVRTSGRENIEMSDLDEGRHKRTHEEDSAESEEEWSLRFVQESRVHNYGVGEYNVIDGRRLPVKPGETANARSQVFVNQYRKEPTYREDSKHREHPIYRENSPVFPGAPKSSMQKTNMGSYEETRNKGKRLNTNPPTKSKRIPSYKSRAPDPPNKHHGQVFDNRGFLPDVYPVGVREDKSSAEKFTKSHDEHEHPFPERTGELVRRIDLNNYVIRDVTPEVNRSDVREDQRIFEKLTKSNEDMRHEKSFPERADEGKKRIDLNNYVTPDVTPDVLRRNQPSENERRNRILKCASYDESRLDLTTRQPEFRPQRKISTVSEPAREYLTVPETSIAKSRWMYPSLDNLTQINEHSRDVQVPTSSHQRELLINQREQSANPDNSPGELRDHARSEKPQIAENASSARSKSLANRNSDFLIPIISKASKKILEDRSIKKVKLTNSIDNTDQGERSDLHPMEGNIGVSNVLDKRPTDVIVLSPAGHPANTRSIPAIILTNDSGDGNSTSGGEPAPHQPSPAPVRVRRIARANNPFMIEVDAPIPVPAAKSEKLRRASAPSMPYGLDPMSRLATGHGFMTRSSSGELLKPAALDLVSGDFHSSGLGSRDFYSLVCENRDSDSEHMLLRKKLIDDRYDALFGKKHQDGRNSWSPMTMKSGHDLRIKTSSLDRNLPHTIMPYIIERESEAIPTPKDLRRPFDMFHGSKETPEIAKLCGESDSKTRKSLARGTDGCEHSDNETDQKACTDGFSEDDDLVDTANLQPGTYHEDGTSADSSDQTANNFIQKDYSPSFQVTQLRAKSDARAVDNMKTIKTIFNLLPTHHSPRATPAVIDSAGETTNQNSEQRQGRSTLAETSSKVYHATPREMSVERLFPRMAGALPERSPSDVSHDSSQSSRGHSNIDTSDEENKDLDIEIDYYDSLLSSTV